MSLLLIRYSSGKSDTLGMMFYRGQFVCYTLEDERRDTKVKGKTCIPAGAYKVSLKTVGLHHIKYAERFPGLHWGMLELQDVPNFKHILIHIGNTHKDTAGCLLVGDGVKTNKDMPGKLLHSSDAYQCLYVMVREEAQAGELMITIAEVD